MRTLASLICLMLFAAAAAAGEFVPLGQDGIHDPSSPAFGLLQEPAEAMSNFPTDRGGNIDWVQTLKQGHIAPRKGVVADEKMGEVDLDIMMTNTASMPHVLFSHSVHTPWLTCSNCHSRIFLPQAGGNFVTMAKILKGEYCGVCHGKVAFSTLDCERCHSASTGNNELR